MLRNDIQRITGLTRKALEYYEEKGFIHPRRLENGYREYSEKDAEILNKIALFKKLGLTITEIKDCLKSDGATASIFLRRKEQELESDKKRKVVFDLYIKGENTDLINEKLAVIEAEDSIYKRLERAFPGYLGQCLFAAYQPFLQEPLSKDGEEAFKKYIQYLDSLPTFELSREEQDYVDELSSSFNMKTLKEVNEAKIAAVESYEKWHNENKDTISIYDRYLNSDDYKTSPMKNIQDQLKTFLIDHHYYEVAIPLIRQFSKSYDHYYKKLTEASDYYLKQKGDAPQ